MEESTRFFSLSGLSGVFMGIFAIAGALIAHYLIFDNGKLFEEFLYNSSGSGSQIRLQAAVAAIGVLIFSLSAAFYFSSHKAKVAGKHFWTPVSKRLFLNLFIPLAAGGLFALILIARSNYELLIPVLLVFYGLGLVNAGKFTFSELFYLGLLEILTGLIAAIFPEQGILLWILGFGLLHILYGLFMYRKYES